MPNHPLFGREYLRVSKDKTGKGRSPSQQHDENVPCAERFGIQLGDPYRDDDRSASKYARKVREDFKRLMEDLERNTFGATVLVLWESSRGSRRAGEWVLLVDLLEELGIQVLVTTHNRMYDPRIPRDRKSLLEDAVHSEYESAETHLRVKRDAARSAARGGPNGICRYGYSRLYDQHSGAWQSDVAHPEESPHMIELFYRLEHGHALKAIARDWEARGIRTRPRLNKETEEMETRPFSSQHLRSMATNAAYMGVRVHRSDGAVKTYKAKWPELVSKRQFLAVQAILTDSSRKTTRDGRAAHLLSGIAICGECGGRMNATKQHGLARYRCGRKGCVVVPKDELDVFGTKLMLGYLAREDNYSAFTAKVDTAELQTVKTQLAESRAEHDALATADVSVALAAKKEPAILARIVTLEAEQARLETPAKLAGLITPGADVATRWNDEDLTPITTKRAIARMLLAPAYLGTLVVQHAGAPRRSDGRNIGGRFANSVPLFSRLVLRRADGDQKALDPH